MAAMARVGLKVAVYIGNGDFYYALPSDICVYASAEQRDIDVMPMVPGSFTPGVAVDSGVHYHVPRVPYRPVVVVPFTECPETAIPHSLVQKDNVISLAGVQELLTKEFKIYSDLMEDTALKLLTTNRLRDEMDMELGHELWEEFCKEEFGDHQEPSDPGTLCDAVKECHDATTMQKALDIARRVSASPTATREEKHSYVLHELATSGYAGGELLRIPQAVGMTLMEDEAFDSLFNRDKSDPVPSRNALQHLIHQNVELAVQASMAEHILQEVDPDVIVQHCEAVSYMLLEIKFLYQQRRIRRYRFEPYRPIQNNRKGRPRVEEGSPSQGETLWKSDTRKDLGCRQRIRMTTLTIG